MVIFSDIKSNLKIKLLNYESWTYFKNIPTYLYGYDNKTQFKHKT